MEVNEVTSKTSAIEDSVKTQIRNLISTLYGIQEVRIGTGNRLTAQFKQSLGIAPSTKDEDADKEVVKLLASLKEDYGRITDGIAENNFSLKKQISLLLKDDKNPLKVVRDTTDYSLIRSYMFLLDSESELTRVIDTYVKSHPLWSAFFEQVKGCGTLMSAVCIAFLDPYKAPHVSSFFRYAGLDVVQDTSKQGEQLWLAVNDGYRVVKQKYTYVYQSTKEDYLGHVIESKNEDGVPIYTTDTGEYLEKLEALSVDGDYIFEDLNGENPYVGTVVAKEHGRSMSDTEMFEYISKDGELKLKKGLTYNPTLKCKLMGVLGSCLIKAKDPVYYTIYNEYKNRLNNNHRYDGYTNARKSNMAVRYMVKQFLRNLWVVWRNLEGLPVDAPYEVDKLGREPHHVNAYQYNISTGRKQSYKDYCNSFSSL